MNCPMCESIMYDTDIQCQIKEKNVTQRVARCSHCGFIQSNITTILPSEEELDLEPPEDEEEYIPTAAEMLEAMFPNGTDDEYDDERY